MSTTFSRSSAAAPSGSRSGKLAYRSSQRSTSEEAAVGSGVGSSQATVATAVKRGPQCLVAVRLKSAFARHNLTIGKVPPRPKQSSSTPEFSADRPAILSRA